MASTKGLNTTGGVNRLRFESFSSRLKKVNFDVIHRSQSKDLYQLDDNVANKGSGVIPCYFQQELEQCKHLDGSIKFKQFYHKIWSLVQSLPELIHHQEKIAQLLVKEILSIDSDFLGSFLHLTSVFARDLQDDLHVHFHLLFGALVQRVTRPVVSEAGSALKTTPEQLEKIYECMSFLIKYQIPKLLETPQSLSPYYGPLLGHHLSAVRDFSARCLVILTRKLKISLYRQSFRKLTKALAANWAADVESEKLFWVVTPLEQSVTIASGESKDRFRKIDDAIEGISLLQFYACKGVKGCLHSNGGERLSSLLSSFLPLNAKDLKELQEMNKHCKNDDGGMPAKKSRKVSRSKKEVDSDGSKIDLVSMTPSLQKALQAVPLDIYRSVFTGKIVNECVRRCFRHLMPQNASELWLRIMVTIDEFSSAWTTLSQWKSCPYNVIDNLLILCSYFVELLIFSLRHSNGRALVDPSVRKLISKRLTTSIAGFINALLNHSVVSDVKQRRELFIDPMVEILKRSQYLFCCLWIRFPSSPQVLSAVSPLFQLWMKQLPPDFCVMTLSEQLLPILPIDVIRLHLSEPLLGAISTLAGDSSPGDTLWLELMLRVFLRIRDHRDRGFLPSRSPLRPRLSTEGKDEEEIWGTHSSDSENDASDSSEDENSFAPFQPIRTKTVRVERRTEFSSTEEIEGILTACEGAFVVLAEMLLREAAREVIHFTKPDADSDRPHHAVLVFMGLRWMISFCPSILSSRQILCDLRTDLMKHLTDGITAGVITSGPIDVVTQWVRLFSMFVENFDDFGGSVGEAVRLSIRSMACNLKPSISWIWSLTHLFEVFSRADSHYLDVFSLEEINAILSKIGDLLPTPSYWLRSCLVTLLKYFPKPELQIQGNAASDKQVPAKEAEYFDLSETLLEIVATPAEVATEREFVRLLGKLEVLIRADRLPLLYARITCAFCLGLLHVKFLPVWEPAISVLVASSAHPSGEEALWPLLMATIRWLSVRSDDANLSVLNAGNSFESPKVKSLCDSLTELSALDSGDDSIPNALSCTEIFFFSGVHASSESTLVDPDARASFEAAYGSIWSVLKKSPNITLRRSKEVVPIFIRFLREQYYPCFNEDPDIPYLQAIGLLAGSGLSLAITDEFESGKSWPILPNRVLRRRLELFLQVFAAVISPRQLYLHAILFDYFRLLLAKPDHVVAKLSLDCLLTYKPDFLTPYKDNVYRLLEDKTLRDELIVFNIASADDTIASSHREDVIPLIVRLVCGKMISKATSNRMREQSHARRIAVLAFLSRLHDHELSPLLHLMLRGIVPRDGLLEYVQGHLDTSTCRDWRMLPTFERNGWQPGVLSYLSSMPPQMFSSVAWERKVGFLHVLEQVIKVMGLGVLSFVDILYGTVEKMLIHAQEVRENGIAVENANELDESSPVLANDGWEEKAGAEEKEENGETDDSFEFSSAIKEANQSLRVRTLCFQRIGEMAQQFHGKFDFAHHAVNLVTPIIPVISSLQLSIAGCSKPPAVLKMIHAFAVNQECFDVINRHEVVKSLVACLAVRAEHVVVTMLLEILTAFLDRNLTMLIPSAEMLVSCISKRFAGSSYNFDDALKLSELKIQVKGSIDQELSFLSRVSEEIFLREDFNFADASLSSLATLILGMVRTFTIHRKGGIEDIMNKLLRIYKSLIFRISDVQCHVPFLSRLFGPSAHSQSAFNLSSVRQSLVEVMRILSSHPSTHGVMTLSSEVLGDLTAMDPRLLESRDFDRCMPVFQGLSGQRRSAVVSWSMLIGPEANISAKEISLCLAILFECIRCMYESDLAVRTGAFSALKSLMDNLADWLQSSRDDEWVRCWSDILTSILVSSIRNGLKHSTDVTKRGFVQLLSHLITLFSPLENAMSSSITGSLHLDLMILRHEDPEQDFFENITHLQIHRRIRALNKLKQSIQESLCQSNGESSTFAISSVVHVLFPLGYHHLVSKEFSKKDHLQLLQEASSFLGVISALLPWNHYLKFLKLILKELDKNDVDKEKVLLTALCSVLDYFHFDLSGEREVEGLVELSKSEPNFEATEILNVERENEVQALDTNEEGEEREETAVASQSPAQNIARVVINSILPWTQVFLLKDVKDHKGHVSRIVRPAVALALIKLVNRFKAPLIPEHRRNAHILNLFISVIGTLRSRDASARDVARESLCKMIKTIGLGALSVALYEMQHLLTEGFQRHVCNYSIRSILTDVLSDYVPPVDAPSVPLESLLESSNDQAGLITAGPSTEDLDFDRCLSSIVTGVMDDLNGAIRDDLAAAEEGAKKVTIRESKGSKANEILEICGRCLLFRPTYALSTGDPVKNSSIHAVTMPLLGALQDCELKEVIGRISEGLQKLALGLSRNPSVLPTELLLYLHATLQPFVATLLREMLNHKRALGKIVQAGERASHMTLEEIDQETALLGDELPSYMKEDSDDDERALYSSSKGSERDDVNGYRAATWLPSERAHRLEQRAVVEERNRERLERDKVVDGAAAPKLTGANKFQSKNTASQVGSCDPASVAAVKFCLTLLHNALKQNKLSSDSEDVRSMINPIVPILGQCLLLESAANVTATAMRCLCSILSWGVTVDDSFSRAVGGRMLKLMFKGGVLLSTDNDLVQACFKGLTALFTLHLDARLQKAPSSKMKKTKDGKDNLNNETAVDKFPLSEPDLRTLLQLMTASVMEATSNFQNAAFQLIRVLVDARVVMPEMYDLINKLTEQIVISHRSGVRDSSSSIVVSFMLGYPMGEKRFAAHVKQLLANCSYEFEDGRCSALSTMTNLCKLLPVPVLEDNAQLIFLPMALRLVNDASSKCRQAAADVITAICRRVTPEIFNVLFGYTLKWLGGSQVEAKPLLRSGASVASVIVAARPDLLKKGNNVGAIVNLVHETLWNIAKSSNDFSSMVSRGEKQKIGRVQSLEMREMSKNSEGEGESGGVEEWALIYHFIILLERLFEHLPGPTNTAVTHPVILGASNPVIMEIIEEAILYPHLWIRSAAGRVLQFYLSRRDVARSRLACFDDGRELLLAPNGLYQLGRKLCIALNQPKLADGLLESLRFCLVFVTRAMIHNPSLCSLAAGDDVICDDEENQGEAEDHDIAEIDQEDEAEAEESDKAEDSDALSVESDGREQKSPQNSEAPGGSNWVVHRLRGIGSDSRGQRRLNVIKVFTSLVNADQIEILRPHLSPIFEVAIRARHAVGGPDEELRKRTEEAAIVLLDQLERKMESSEFIGLFSDVQKSIKNHKLEKKRKLASEAIHDPKNFAMRKRQKAEEKKRAKKRRSAKFAAAKGKKQRGNDAIIYK